MRATSSSFLLHDNLFFFLNDHYGCDMWSYLESVFFSALLNVANVILSVLELFFFFWGGGGGGGRGNQTRQSENEQPMKAGLTTDNNNSGIEGSKPYL